MSTKNTHPQNKGFATGGIEVSQHAKLRFLERVQASEPFPGDRVREIVREGDRVDLPAFNLPVRMRDGVAVLFDETAGEAVTVLVPSPAQLAAERAHRAGEIVCSSYRGDPDA